MSKNDHEVRDGVREHYAAVAEGGESCCGTSCSDAAALGYGEEDASAAPDGADLGLGCGNPLAIASLRTGETVLDLGSGGGFDCFLAAREVGPDGHVIGVDMTPEMLARARANAAKMAETGIQNVEFRLGEIEHLPVADRSVDVILSNCVINLAPDKRAVFSEALRVLRPGGRLSIMDVVAIAPMPTDVTERSEALPACVAGAITPDEIRDTLKDLGFQDVRVDIRRESATFIKDWLPDARADLYVASASIEAVRARDTSQDTGCC